MRLTIRATLTVSFLLLFLPQVVAEDDPLVINVQNEIGYTMNDVSGSGASQSNLNKDNAYQNTISLNMNSDTLYMNLGGRLTDDRTAELKNISLTNMQFRATMGNSVFNIGDTFESFSQYGLGSALKGAFYKYRSKAKNSPEYTLVAGYSYPRWDNIYGDKSVKAIKRTAYGFNVKKDLSDTWKAGIHYLKTGDSNRITASDPLYNGNIYIAYWEYKPFDGLSLTGESAFSNTVESPSATEADKRYNGSAHKISFAGDSGPNRLNLDYERVSPRFLSVLGAATSDREKIKVKWREKQNKDTSVTYGLLWYRDNLDNQKANTTNRYKPEINYVKRNLFGKKSASGDISYKLDLANGGGSNTTNHFVDLGYRDRFDRVETDTKLGMVTYSTNNGVRKSNEYTINTTLSARFSAGNFAWKPSIALGTWRSTDELTDQTDRIWEYSLGMGIDVPEIDLVTSIKVGRHKLIKSVGDDTARNFGRLDINHRLKTSEGSPERSLFLRWYINDFNNSDITNNYNENSLETGMNIRY